MRNLAILGVVVFLLTAAAVIWQAVRMDARHRNGRSLIEPVDVAIVLGAGVDPDGVLRFTARRRVLAGVALLKNGMAHRLIMSGSPLKNSPESIASMMRAHALSLGAASEAILVEERATSTLENLQFSLPIAREAGAERIAIVTDQYHLTRARWLAEALGERDLQLVAAPGLEYARRFERIYEISRETLAWWYNFLKIAKIRIWDTNGPQGTAANRTVGPEDRPNKDLS